MKLITHYFLMIAIFGGSFGYSQHYPYTTIKLKDGLPQGSVYKIVQDHQGYIWMATGGGICRYDGYEFVTYTYGSGLEASQINDIETDSKGRLWIATYGKGIAVYDGTSFRSFNSSNGFPFNNIRDIYFDEADDLWLSTVEKGVVRVCISENVNISIFPSIPESFRPRRFFEQSNGNIGCFGSEGYIEFDKSRSYKPKLNLGSDYLICGMKDRSEGFWIGGRNVLYYKKGGTIINKSAWLLPQTDVREFIMDGNNLYISTTTGILKVNGNNIRRIRKENGLANNFTHSIYKDHFGNIWVGSEDGATILNDHAMVHYDSDGEGGDMLSFTLVEDKMGEIWVGKALKGYYICSDSGITRLQIRFPDAIVPLQAYRDFAGDIIVLANFRTIYKVTNRDITWEYKVADSILRVNTILPLLDSTLLVGTSSGVFTISEDKKIEWVKNIESESYVCGFYDDDGNIWLTADGGGVYKIKDYKAIDYSSTINPEKDIIKHALFDPFHHLWWFCTERGLLVWTGKNRYRINTSNGLKSNLTYSITQDSIGRIWTGHLQGVECIDLEKKKITHFGYDQGFLPIETNGRAAITDSKGNVWFGTANSATKIIVSELAKDTIGGILRLQSIYVNEKEMFKEGYNDSVLPGLHLSHDQNNLEFHVASLCYSNAKNVIYSWKMEGIDKHWNKKINHREIEYVNLPPGKYKLRITALNPDGFETNEITVSIYIAKPFWQTAAFYISEILVFILIIFLSFRFSKKSSKNRLGQVMTLLTILIVFESMMLYISGYTDKYTNGIPIFQLLMNVVLAASLYPLEQKIKRFLEKRNPKA